MNTPPGNPVLPLYQFWLACATFSSPGSLVAKADRPLGAESLPIFRFGSGHEAQLSVPKFTDNDEPVLRLSRYSHSQVMTVWPDGTFQAHLHIRGERWWLAELKFYAKYTFVDFTWGNRGKVAYVAAEPRAHGYNQDMVRVSDTESRRPYYSLDARESLLDPLVRYRLDRATDGYHWMFTPVEAMTGESVNEKHQRLRASKERLQAKWDWSIANYQRRAERALRRRDIDNGLIVPKARTTGAASVQFSKQLLATMNVHEPKFAPPKGIQTMLPLGNKEVQTHG